MTALTIDLSSIVQLTRAEFYKLCAANPELNLERSDRGELIVLMKMYCLVLYWI
jgi:hypothetical protein